MRRSRALPSSDFRLSPRLRLLRCPAPKLLDRPILSQVLARAVGEGGGFDLHHIRAQIGEQAPCFRADDDHAEVEDLQAFKRSG
jgi:hypothetical protein